MSRPSADLAALLAENHDLREENDSLRTALGLKQARADYRDAAKHEVAKVLELPEAASIHEIIAAIRGVVAERDRLRAEAKERGA